MPEGKDSARRKPSELISDMLYKWRWWIWSGFMLAWTVALLAPTPPHGTWGESAELDMERKFYAAKTLHVSVYAFLSVLSAGLRAPARYRFLLVFCLMAHATLTEVLQVLLEGITARNGNLMDVALDQIGITIGIAIAWRWWTA
jgi:VanZ family protein